MPKRRGTRSEVRREFPLVRTTAFPKLRGTELLTENERQVWGQQPAADLDRLDRAADGGPCGAGAAADSSHDRHEQRHQQELQQGDIHLAKIRSAFTVLQTSGPKSNPNRSELLDPRIMHKVQRFYVQQTLWKGFEFLWRAFLIAHGKKYRELLAMTDDPRRRCTASIWARQRKS